MRTLKEIRNLIRNYHVKSGVYHYYRSEFKRAVEFLRKALRDDGDLSEADRRNASHYLTLALMDLASRNDARGDLEAAVRELRSASDVGLLYPDIHYRLGRLLDRMGNRPAAIAEFREAIGRRNDYLEAWVALGLCQLGAEATADAADAFRRALELKLERTERPFRQGMALMESGDREKAAEFLHEALLGVPQLAEEHIRKAVDWLRVEEFQKALDELDAAVAVNPKYPDLHNYRGIALCELDRPEEAIEAFALSASLRPRYLVPRLNLAFTYVRAGQYREAEAELERVLEQDPTEPVALAKLEELRTAPPAEKRRPVSRGSVR